MLSVPAVYSLLSDCFDQFREEKLSDRFFKHADVRQLIGRFDKEPAFEVISIGSSVEGREIICIKTGKGETKIMLWSQMHGNEPTATMAIFDWLNFFSASGDSFDEIRNHVLASCTLYFVPMLNPDGAERFTRRNAQGIDINRDFLKQQSPEARVLMDLHCKITPDFAFNLHDQSVRWSAGLSGNPAAVSLLAPAFDEAVCVNPSRTRAIQVCCCLNDILQQLAPGHIGRFKDDFEPRSFGDNFQAMGTSTILVETGGHKNDPEKQQVRKMLFLSVIYGLQMISGGSYTKRIAGDYYDIPANLARHYSILLKNCSFSIGNISCMADIGLLSEPGPSLSGYLPPDTFIVEDLGDLSGFFGYEEIDTLDCSFMTPCIPAPSEPATFSLERNGSLLLSVRDGKIIVKNC